MGKFIKFLLREGIINEAPRSDEVEYEEVKEKSGAVKEVIAILSKQKATAATKIINDFVEAEEQMKYFQKIRNELKPSVLESLSKFFDAADELVTRRIKTAKWILTISKKSPKKGTEVFEEEEFFKELAVLTGMQVEAIKALKEKFVKKIPGEGFVDPTISTKLASESFLREGVMDTLKKWANAVYEVFKQKIFPKIDKKFQELQKKWG